MSGPRLSIGPVFVGLEKCRKLLRFPISNGQSREGKQIKLSAIDEVRSGSAGPGKTASADLAVNAIVEVAIRVSEADWFRRAHAAAYGQAVGELFPKCIVS